MGRKNERLAKGVFSRRKKQGSAFFEAVDRLLDTGGIIADAVALGAEIFNINRTDADKLFRPGLGKRNALAGRLGRPNRTGHMEQQGNAS